MSGAGAPPAEPAPARGILDDGTRTKGALVRGGVLRFAGYVGTVGLSVVSVGLLTRHLGISRFGQYTTVTSLVAIVAAVTDSGMSNIGTREYATLREPQRGLLLRDLLGLRVTLTLAGVAVVTAWSIALGYGDPLVLGALGASLATVSLVFQHTLTIPLTTDLRLGWLSLLELMRQAVTVTGIVVLIVLGAGLFPLLAITLVANTLLILPSALLVRGRISLRPAIRPAHWRRLMGATVAFSLATAVGVIYVYAAQVLTSIVASHRQTGLFSVSFRVFIVSAGIPGLLVGSALPVLSRAARDDRDRLAYILQRIFEAGLVVGVGVAVATSAGAGFIVSVIAPRAVAATSVLEIQAFALIASFVTAGWGFALVSLRLHRPLLVANAVALVVSLGATLLLAARDGAQGAAIATVLGESALALTSLIALVAGRPQYRPRLGVVWKILLGGGLAATAAFVPAMASIVRAIVALAVYGAVVLLTGALPPELSELLPVRMRPH